MFDGRHCTKQDLTRLIEETNKVKQNFEKTQKIGDLRGFLAFLARFDEDVSRRLTNTVTNEGTDCERVLKAIDSYVDELKQNVIVDIYEHQTIK